MVKLDFGAPMTSFCCFGRLESARGRLASSLSEFPMVHLFTLVAAAIVIGWRRSQASIGRRWTRHSVCLFALCCVWELIAELPEAAFDC